MTPVDKVCLLETSITTMLYSHCTSQNGIGFFSVTASPEVADTDTVGTYYFTNYCIQMSGREDRALLESNFTFIFWI